METVVLEAQVRKESKKGPARRLRERGFTPAIFYGYRMEPVMLQVSEFELKRVLKKSREESIFIALQIADGEMQSEKLSVLKDIQVNTIKKRLDHADFYEVRMDKELTLPVPIILTGEAAGVEKGGELNFIKRELKVSGLPSLLPDSIEVDVSHLDVGDSVKVEDIPLMDGVTACDSQEVIIANVGMTRAALAAAGAASRESMPEGEEETAMGESEGEGSESEG